MMFFTRVRRFLVLFVHLFRTTFQMLYGAWRISKLPGPIVTIFGSSRIKQNTPYAQKAREMGQRFIDNDISILTGGGPGIMEAASCNIQPKKGVRQSPLVSMCEDLKIGQLNAVILSILNLSIFLRVSGFLPNILRAL